jgi:hypothetical protein
MAHVSDPNARHRASFLARPLRITQVEGVPACRPERRYAEFLRQCSAKTFWVELSSRSRPGSLNEPLRDGRVLAAPAILREPLSNRL